MFFGKLGSKKVLVSRVLKMGRFVVKKLLPYNQK